MPATKEEPESFTSIEEYRRYCSPKLVLDRLETRLCSYLGLTEPYQYRLSKDKNDVNIGVLELAKPNWPHDLLADVVADFYKTEGFEVKVYDTNPNLISLAKGRKEYSCTILQQDKDCQVHQTDKKYQVYISKDPFPALVREFSGKFKQALK